MSSALARTTWLGTMKLWRRWFRYEVEGLEHLRSHRCHVVVGYHGRPLAWDLFLLGAALYEEQGVLPVAVVHRAFEADPYLRWLTDGLGWTTGRGPVLEDAAKRGRHIILAPGGEREGLRTIRTRYEVSWSDHTGYLRFALKRGLPIVPVASAGVDDAYHGLVDTADLRRWLKIPDDRMAWLGVGPLGLFPWSPPYPVHLHQIVGEPIDLQADGPVDADDPDRLLALHTRVQGEVQALLDRARRSTAPCCRGRLRPLLSP